jgi:hypothetical protein
MAACHKPDAYLLSPTLADQVLTLTLSATTLPADGISRTTITAQLDPRTDFDKRTVTFATTAGTLIADGKADTSITMTADTSGKAVVELRSSTSATTARIDVTVATVARTTSVEFTKLAREDVFDVTLSSTSVPADNFSTAMITVRLKRLGTIDQRAIKFETSAGTFIASGQPTSRNVTLTAGETGIAVVELRSDAVGTAFLRITALDTLYESAITFTALAREDTFDVSVGSTSIPADGFSTTTITATLKRSGTPQQRMFKFETSAGTLIAPGQPSGRTLTIAADAAGRASVDLQSDKTVGSARVRVTAFDLPYEFSVAFTGVSPGQVINIAVAPASGPADGVTPLLVTATVAAGLPAGRRTVAFRTSLGVITPALIDADGSNVARATVTSAVTGQARITATVDGVTAETTAQFTSSLPDRVFVAPDVAQLSSGGSTTIRVTLTRTVGAISPRLEVTFSATTSSGGSIGSFSRVTLADNGVATATFNVGTTAYLGPVTIAAAVEGGATGSATIQIVP